jgi:hypothetical protein
LLRRSDHPHHATELAWVEQALADAAAGRSFVLQPMVAASFLRLDALHVDVVFARGTHDVSRLAGIASRVM